MRNHRWMLLLVLLFALVLTGCGEDDDDDSSGSPSDDDQTDDDTGDDDIVDDDQSDDDQTDDDTGDDDTSDDDTGDDDTVPVDPIDAIDPFLGSGGIGFGYASAYPGPKAPWGMMGLSPDTTIHGFNYGFNHFSGFYYPDTQIRGFTHNHLHGTGAADMSMLLVMPTNAMPETPISEKQYRSDYSHETETATAGYYSVMLETPGVFAELATRDYAAIHRYTFPEKGEPHVVVNPTYSIEPGWVWDATVEIEPAQRRLTGYIDFHGSLSGRDGGIILYYVMEFSQDFAAYGTWNEGDPTANSTTEQGTDIGAYFRFGALTEPLLVRVGISYQDIDQAKANLADQMSDWDFDAAVEDTRGQWQDIVDKIEVSGGTAEQREIFYTALYHSYIMPTDWTEANNKYHGFDHVYHDAGDRRYYTDFSLWDTFRTLHPLMNLIEPEASADMMQSLTLMYEQGGAIPRWPLGEGYTGCMIGSSAHVTMAEAYLKGITDWDYETGYRGCYEQATTPGLPRGRSGLNEYINLGWVCEDLDAKGTSDTLEYSYDDAALSWWAEALGYTEDAEIFEARSHNYQNHWDPEIQFLRGRNCDGSFVEPYSPDYVFGEQYVEGNAWHWSFYAPHDPEGMIDLFGSEQAFVDKINLAFTAASEGTGAGNHWFPDVYYWHGNEPDLFNSYLFDYTSRPDLTQKWVRWVMETKYKTGPDGLDGNDDCGTLSAWYVFSAMGFFPLAGSDKYFIGSPLFDEVVVHLDGGDLTITADNNSPENMYVQSVTLNGSPLETTWFTHDQIVNGGTLHFVMGSTPSDWGTKK